MYLFDGDDANRTLIFLNGGALAWGAGTYPNVGATDTNDNQHVFNYNGTDSSFQTNGTTLATGQNVNTGTNDGMTIGTRYTASNFLDGRIAEIVMFKSSGTTLSFSDAWVSRYISNNNLYFDIY